MNTDIFSIFGRSNTLPLRAKALLAFAGGCAAAFAMPPFSFWPLLFPALGGLYLLLAGDLRTKQAFAVSYLYGFGYFLSGLWWIGNALLVEGNEYQWAWPLAVIGLPLLLALFPALCLTAFHLFARYRTIPGFCGFMFALALSEWLRGHLFTGFPWNLYGYGWSHIDAIIQTASVGGIYFLTLLTIFWGGAAGFLLIWQRPLLWRLSLFLFVTATIGLSFLYGHNRLGQYEPSFHNGLELRIVQANIPQHEKWDSAFFRQNFEKYLSLSSPPALPPEKDRNNKEPPGSTIVIWPETAISFYHLENEVVHTALQEMLESYETPAYLLTGILHRHGADYTNSLTLYDKNLAPVTSYDKSHLVPFGEYIPFQDYIPLKTVTSFTGFKPGNGPVSQNAPAMPLYSPLVCYEIIFPGTVVNRSNRPGWIINVTNDGWYGNSPGPYQHLVKAKFRAIEEGIPVIRAAGTGISAVINPAGQIIHKIGYGKDGVLTARLPQALPAPTLYARTGETVFSGFMLLLLLVFILSAIKNKR